MTLEKRFKKILESSKLETIPCPSTILKGGDCVLYLGAHINQIPVIEIDGKQRGIVRQMFEFFNNRKIIANSRISNRCGKKACINPQHWNIRFEHKYGDEGGCYLRNYTNGRDYKG